MKERILRETRFPIFEFVFRCTEKRVWLSLESVKDDSVFMKIASLCLRTSEFNDICDEVCEKINSVYKIKANKRKIMNIIKLFNKEENRLSILKLNLVNGTSFNREEGRFNEYAYPEVSLCSNLQFMQDQRQYSKMYHLFVANNISDEMNEKIFKLIRTVYDLTVENNYDIFSSFEGENIL